MDLWRRNNALIVSDELNVKILNKIARLKAKQIHYVVGNHDYYMIKLGELYQEHYPFTISKHLRLEDGGQRFYFIHGYELEVLVGLEPLSIENYEGFSEQMCFNEDVMGGFASKLYDLLKSHNSTGKL